MRSQPSKWRNTALGQRLKQPVRALFARFGLEVQAVNRPETRRLRHLLRRVDPDLLIDVGANQGQFAMRARTIGYGGPIVSIEPVGSAYALLRRNSADDPRWQARQLAVADTVGEALMLVSANSVGSSLLTPTDAQVRAEADSRIERVERVAQRPLDDALDDLPFSRAWLKIDVQGAERRVLDGASRTLGRTSILQCELSICELYAGQELYLPMLQHLDGLGFSLFDIEVGFRDPQTWALLQFDGIFLRRGTTVKGASPTWST